ncbi:MULTISPECIES: hypothetical protein [Photorhabdus]|uniref:hypothetical protein n=1 Tax=Photorhabdus TaxID=29487 RepID=UPI0007B45DD9|nr:MULTISPECIES: hypothetical protein [Photorhabdus]AXG42220.1 hypothetical protein PluDJC_08125 [Photorhabdus laumondii subsp. laumondii]AXG42427.1 hypothetical protein PluDJC_09265 [Photorhabdus laumondii subsp. laumondii]MCC8387680.1 hypothetical protein [Photorhabdus laumondii]MCZ1247942.1 hypothetical protein [Photorhabdus laumondii subsp. laumondii]NDL15049.1 hypothetical protein [Photorhabdus laumondii subsp. laumondii]
MKIARCPICHSDWHLEALCEDDASRQLLKMLSELPGSCARHLVAYIGLFRREKQNLSNSRALKLAGEVLALYTPSRVLAHALSETVERIREKRAQGDKKPLSNHNYLKTVYQSAEQIIAQSSNINAREKQQISGSDSRDAYFRQMQQLGIDLAKISGGLEWLKSQGEET